MSISSDQTTRSSGIKIKRKVPTDKAESINVRSEDVLLSIALLGLAGCVADGEADYREVSAFCSSFRDDYALSRKRLRACVGLALNMLPKPHALEAACDCLNQEMTTAQKLLLFERLAELMVVDGKIHSGEELYLAFIGDNLNLLTALKERHGWSN